MKLSTLILLALTVFSMSSCLIFPFDDGHNYYGEHERPEDGRRVWRE